jgi:multimeric flavodoxin WrbA
MDVIVVSASPNRDGLTAACAAAAEHGIRIAGGQAEEIRLNDLAIGLCRACNDGWGTCRSERRCEVEDDFQGVHGRMRTAGAIVLASPVYYGQMSESAKAFTDRLRRCEARRGGGGCLDGKPVILIAAAGGGGGGTTTCLQTMENWAHHVGARVFDLVPVKQSSRSYKLTTIREAARALVACGGASTAV